MSKTYLEMANDILREVNEVSLTTLTNAKNIQGFVKEAINRSYLDIVNEEANWSFLSVNETTSQYGGISTDISEGVQWYYLNSEASSTNGATTDYIAVEWEDFLLTTEGVSTPIIYENLEFLPIEEWKDINKLKDTRALNDSSYRGKPQFVIRSPNNRKFGLSPIPDKDYKVYFQAYKQPTTLSDDTDTLVFPNQYYSVLYARVRYYAWQFKEHSTQAQMALSDYNKGIRRMKEQLIDSKPTKMTDDRVLYA
jgi:hypothetical protein